MPVQTIGSADFAATLKNKTVLVEFMAPWCGPCKAIAPALEELSVEFPDAHIVKVDIDQSPDLTARYNVRGVPFWVLFRDGQVLRSHAGTLTKQRLRGFIRGEDD